MLVVENALKETVAEVRNLRKTIDELSGMKTNVDGMKATLDSVGGLFENIQTAKIALDARLDSTFAEWKLRVGLSRAPRSATWPKLRLASRNWRKISRRS